MRRVDKVRDVTVKPMQPRQLRKVVHIAIRRKPVVRSLQEARQQISCCLDLVRGIQQHRCERGILCARGTRDTGFRCADKQVLVRFHILELGSLRRALKGRRPLPSGFRRRQILAFLGIVGGDSQAGVDLGHPLRATHGEL